MDILQQAADVANQLPTDARQVVLAFARHAKAQGARDKDQVGARVVVSYWKALSKTRVKHDVQHDHWKALCELWRVWGKGGVPPEPWRPKPISSMPKPLTMQAYA